MAAQSGTVLSRKYAMGKWVNVFKTSRQAIELTAAYAKPKLAMLPAPSCAQRLLASRRADA
jgi:hypothetical protein